MGALCYNELNLNKKGLTMKSGATKQLCRLQSLKKQLDDIQLKMKGTVNIINASNVLGGRFSVTESSQFSSLKEYLKENHPAVSQSESYEDIVKLLLYAKYITEGHTQYNANFNELYKEGVRSEIKEISKNVVFFSLVTDLSIARELEREIDSIDKEMLDLRYFYASHQTGRVSAYQDYDNGAEVAFKNPETQENEQYTITNLVAKKSDGEQELSLLGHIYTPKEKSAHPIVYVCWRGSKKLDSWYSDTQLAAGVESYLAHEVEILDLISTAIEAVTMDQKKKVSLFVTGHSLGGGLAQTCYNSIQRALLRGNDSINKDFKSNILEDFSQHIDEKYLAVLLNNSRKSSRLDPKMISSMHIGVWNSPGVLNSIAQSSDKCSKELVDLKIEQLGHFAHVSGDLVQVCGDGTILTDSANKAEIEVLDLDNGQASCYPKITAVLCGGVVGGVAGSVLPVGGTISGGTAGITAMSGLMLYAQKRAHSDRFFTENGILTEDETVLKAHKIHSKGDGAEWQGKLKNKSPLLRMFSRTSSQYDILGKREDIKKKAKDMAAKSLQSFWKKRKAQPKADNLAFAGLKNNQ